MLSDYQNDVDPNIIQFSLQFTNTYLNAMAAYGSVTISGGTPFYEAILVNDTNTADAVWELYSGTNLVVSLTAGDGVYNVQVGLRGLWDNAAQSWLDARLILDTVPPVLTITNPTTATVGQPMIQLQGYANESLSGLTFDVSNAAGIWTNQTGYTTGRFYDTNLLAFTTNWFQGYDLALTNGLNSITLRATDLADNTTTTNLNLTLDYSSVTNPPALTVVWPQDGAQIAASDTFTLQAAVNDPTATVQATISDAYGDTNTVQALVERDGTVLAQNLPLEDITNTITLTASNAAGYTGQTTFTVYESAATVTLNPLSSNQLNQSFVNVSGSISASGYALTVNGVPATVNGDLTWTADNVPVNPGGMANFDMQVYDSNNHPAGSQTASQPQPVTVELMSYASSYHQAYTGVGEGDGYENSYDNWSYVWGGNDYGNEALWHQGEDNATNNWNHLLPAGLGAFTATLDSEGLSFVAQTGLMTGTFNNVVLWFGRLYGAHGTYSYQAQSETMIEPSEQPAAGGTALYLVEASAMSYTNVTDALNLGSGEVPVAPEKLAINGQPLVNSHVTNADGSVWGMTLVSAPAGATVRLTTTALAKLYSFTNQAQEVHFAIIDANSGQDLTLQTNAVMVGQQMNLYAQLLVTNFTPTSFQWTVPGITFSDYVASATSAVLYTNFPTGDSNVVFYWADGASNRVVQCAATVNGAKVTGQAVFNVLRPDVTWTLTPKDSVAVDTNFNGSPFYAGHYYLRTGKNFSTNDVGMLYSFQVIDMKGYTGGYEFQFIQTISMDWKRNLDNGEITGSKSLDGTACDNLGSQYYYQSWANAPSGFTEDTPADALEAQYSFYWRQDNFKCYLMFKPDGGKSVPLKVATWNWYGQAQRDNTNSPPLFHGVPPFTNQLAAAGVNWFSHPEWTNSSFYMQQPDSSYWQYHASQYPTP